MATDLGRHIKDYVADPGHGMTRFGCSCGLDRILQGNATRKTVRHESFFDELISGGDRGTLFP